MPRIWCHNCDAAVDAQATDCESCGETGPFKSRPARMNIYGVESNPKRLDDMVAAKVDYVGIAASKVDHMQCQAALDMEGKKLFPKHVPKLPLPGCDACECGCFYIAIIK